MVRGRHRPQLGLQSELQGSSALNSGAEPKRLSPRVGDMDPFYLYFVLDPFWITG
jgi:hypothetical protein